MLEFGWVWDPPSGVEGGAPGGGCAKTLSPRSRGGGPSGTVDPRLL